MTAVSIPSKIALLILVVLATPLCVATSMGDEVVSIRLSDGKKMTAEVHPRTNDEHLWLRFGDGQTVILRAVAWERIADATMNDQDVSVAEIRRLAASEASATEDASTASPQHAAPPSYARQARRLLGFTRRITAVDFDAHVANWDRDVEFDGIALRLFPLDADGRLARARGTLHVELVAVRRREFNDVPNARGQVPSRVGRWTIAVNADEVSESGVVVKLPFQTNHPEFDTSWATQGLVHVRFVVPGHGVFEHSFDGIRVRPYAPLRDAMERNGRQRFLPTESTSVNKRIR